MLLLLALVSVVSFIGFFIILTVNATRSKKLEKICKATIAKAKSLDISNDKMRFDFYKSSIL